MGLLSGLLGKAKSFISGAIKDPGAAIKKVADTASDILNGGMGKFKEVATSLVPPEYKGIASGLIDKAETFFSGIQSKITGFIGGAGNSDAEG